MAVPFWVVSTLIPCLGLFITLIMWMAPLKSVLEVRRSGNLGTLNTLPFPLTMMNCTGWVIYGCMLANPFVFFANFPGLILSAFYMLSTFTIVDKFERERVELLFYFSILVWGSVGYVAGAGYRGSDSGSLYVGYIACFFALGYYAAGTCVRYRLFYPLLCLLCRPN
jgi:hypothetical protein